MFLTITSLAMEQANIQFCLDETQIETYEMQRTGALSCICVFEWFKLYEDGNYDLHSDPRSGCPTSQNAMSVIW
jgi:hypothetical protein